MNREISEDSKKLIEFLSNCIYFLGTGCNIDEIKQQIKDEVSK